MGAVTRHDQWRLAVLLGLAGAVLLHVGVAVG